MFGKQNAGVQKPLFCVLSLSCFLLQLLVAEEKSETIEVREEVADGKGKEEGSEETMEEEDVLSRLRSEKEGEVTGGEGGEEEEEEEEVVAYSRRWTDSLKINRKKSKQEQHEEKGKDSG